MSSVQNSPVIIKPMEWSSLNDIDEVEPLNENDYECLEGIYNVLKKHKKELRFGVTLIHKHFKVSDDEVLLEHCDSKTRTLTLRPAKKDSDEVNRSMQTSWLLSEEGVREPNTACYRRCERNILGNHEMGGHYWA